MPFENLQQRLTAILDHATQQLPERAQPRCLGVQLAPDATTTNGAQSTQPEKTILCPKPHIGADIFDLVNADTDCLKNPRLCHVIGQYSVPPYLARNLEHSEKG